MDHPDHQRRGQGEGGDPVGVGARVALPGQVPESGDDGGDTDHRHHPHVTHQPADRRQDRDARSVGEMPPDVSGVRLHVVAEDWPVGVVEMEQALGGTLEGREDVHPG